MKKKLFKTSFLMFLFLGNLALIAQSDPSLTGVDLSTNNVTIQNLGDADVDVSNYWVCLGPGQYGRLGALPIVSGDYMLSENESVTFTFSLIAAENVDGAGGLGLFSTNSFGSTDSAVYVDFMQWGGANQDRSGQAVTAGIWSDAQEFISCSSPFSTAIATNGINGGNPTAWNDADGGSVSIDLVATGNPNSTTSFNGDTEVVICVDGRMDTLTVEHETLTVGRSYHYVIVDADTGLILNVVNTNEINLETAAVGVCEIWGWSYTGVDGNGLNQIGEPLSALDDLPCSDISDNAITVIREEANGGSVSIDLVATNDANGTTIITDQNNVSIIVGDGVDSSIVVERDNLGAENLSYRYVIVNADTGLILDVVNTNEISLEAAAVGTCEIWGWSYRGVDGNGLDQVGEPLSALDDLPCSDISDNAIVVVREGLLSAEDVSINFDFAVYPNPAKDIVSVDYAGSQLLNFQVDVYDITGRVVYSNSFESQEALRVDMSNLSSGTYMFNILAIESGSIITKRIIKQ